MLHYIFHFKIYQIGKNTWINIEYEINAENIGIT